MIERIGHSKVLYANKKGRDIRLSYQVSTNREVDIKAFKGDCITELNEGLMEVEEGSRSVVDENSQSVDIYLSIDEDLLNTSPLWTSDSSAYGSFEICIIASLIDNMSNSQTSAVVVSHSTLLDIYADYTIQENDLTLFIDNEYYDGIDDEVDNTPAFTLRICQCNLSDECITQPLSPKNNVMNVCLRLNTTEIEFAGIRAYTISQGDNISIYAVKEGKENLLTEVTIASQFARVSTLLVAAVFENPSPLHIKGLATFSSTTSANTTRRLMEIDYLPNFELEVPVIATRKFQSDTDGFSPRRITVAFSVVILFLASALITFGCLARRRLNDSYDKVDSTIKDENESNV